MLVLIPIKEIHMALEAETGQSALGDSVWAGKVDKATSRAPFQTQPFCNSVKSPFPQESKTCAYSSMIKSSKTAVSDIFMFWFSNKF